MVRVCGCGNKADHVDLFVPYLTRIAQISGKPSVLHLDEVDLYTGEVACAGCAPFLMMMGRKLRSFKVAKQLLHDVKWYHRKKRREKFFENQQTLQKVGQVSA